MSLLEWKIPATTTEYVIYILFFKYKRSYKIIIIRSDFFSPILVPQKSINCLRIFFSFSLPRSLLMAETFYRMNYSFKHMVSKTELACLNAKR